METFFSEGEELFLIEKKKNGSLRFVSAACTDAYVRSIFFGGFTLIMYFL